MTKDKKIEQVCGNFSLLNEKEQDYVLGIVQALAFATDAQCSGLPVNEPLKSAAIFCGFLPSVEG